MSLRAIEREKRERERSKMIILKCPSFTAGAADPSRVSGSFGGQSVKKGLGPHSSSCWLIGMCAGSLHSDEQAVEQGGALLLADPLDL